MNYERGQIGTQSEGHGCGRRDELVEINANEADPARIHDYLGGGSANFKVDREAVTPIAGLGVLDNARADTEANRSFVNRVVRCYVDAGIDQFLDLGCGVPNGVDDVRTLVSELVPGARVAFVDKSPIVLAHAHLLLRNAPAGTVGFFLGDLRHPGSWLCQCRGRFSTSTDRWASYSPPFCIGWRTAMIRTA